MKKSTIILVAVACFVIILSVCSLMILRNDIKSMQNSESNKRYKEIDVTDFTALDFSDKWIVKVKQGNKFKVELAEDAITKSSIQNINGVLYFNIDSTHQNSDNLYARITVPSLEAIKAVQGTRVHVESFLSDSLNVILESGSTFTGNNNHFKKISFKTSVDSWIQLTGDY